MSMQKTIQSELNEAAKVLDKFIKDPDNLKAIEEGAKIMVNSLKEGGKIISCGNGGSHCDAMHFAEEMTGKFREERDPMPAMAVSDPAYLSCTSNDFGYNKVFSRFVRAFGQKGDVLLAISTSGNSGNVLRAAEYARQKGMKVVSLTGKNGGDLAEFSDAEVRVPHKGYADRIQEIHIKVIHIFIQLIEENF